MSANLYRRVSNNASFSSQGFSVGEDEYSIEEVKRCNADSPFGMVGLCVACLGLLGLLDGEARIALALVPIGIAMFLFSSRFGFAKLTLDMEDRRSIQYVSWDAELINYINRSVVDGLNRKKD